MTREDEFFQKFYRLAFAGIIIGATLRHIQRSKAVETGQFSTGEKWSIWRNQSMRYIIYIGAKKNQVLANVAGNTVTFKRLKDAREFISLINSGKLILGKDGNVTTTSVTEEAA